MERAVHEAQVRGVLSHSEIGRALARSAHRRGAACLRELLSDVDPGPRLRSELERRFLSLLEQTLLPPPQTNLLVEIEGHLHEVDFAWPEHRLAVELDGAAFHRTRQAWEADHQRDARFARAGWRVLRFTWRQVTGEPAAVVATVSAAASGREPVVATVSAAASDARVAGQHDPDLLHGDLPATGSTPLVSTRDAP